MTKKKNVIISEGNKPFWQLVVSAVHYTAIVSLLIFFFIGFELTTETKKLKGSFNFLEAIIYLLPTALYFSVVKNFLFDFGERKYKIQYCVGAIKVGSWKNLPEIEYVSVFKQPKTDGDFTFEVNLWYFKNRHFNIYESDDSAPAFELGQAAAKVLNVKLLNATVPNSYKWVKLNKINTSK